MRTRSAINVVCWVRLRMQEYQSVSAATASKRLMMLHDYSHNNYDDHHESHHQLLSSSCCGSGSGPMFCTTSNQVACMSYIYDVVGAAASGSATNTAAAPVPSNSPNPCKALSFKSSASAGEMAASMKVSVPFTATQLQELERQTMIYKYMMASVPVPDELLLPINKTKSPLPSQSKTDARFLSNNLDPEPWRCRRTDGKKWRCSRDVAPDQKYCERHCHRSRTRSRKPVELPAHSRSLNLASSTINKPYSKSHFLNKSISSSALAFDQQPRCLDCLMKRETITIASNSNSSQEWQQIMQSKLESRRDNINGDEHSTERLCNSNSYINFGGDGGALQPHLSYDQYNLLLTPNLVPEHTQIQETRHFIDAWSIAEGNIANVDKVGSRRIASSNEKLPHYSVTLSMSSGSEPIERNENVLMGSLGTMSSETENVGTFRPHWLNHVSPPGGPLAEALFLGIASSAKSNSNEASPHKCSTSTTTSCKSSYGNGGQGPNFIN